MEGPDFKLHNDQEYLNSSESSLVVLSVDHHHHFKALMEVEYQEDAVIDTAAASEQRPQ